MPRQEMTYGQLLALKNDIQYQRSVSAAFYYFNKSRVEKFMHLNSMALKVLQSRLDEYVKKYVMFDRDQQPVKETVDGKEVYKFYSEEMKEKYQAAVDKFLALKISIEL